MKSLRIRRLFLLMLLSGFALVARFSHADDQYLKAAHILDQITALEKVEKAANDNVDFRKFMKVADELSALHPTMTLRQRTLFKTIQEKMGNLLHRYSHNPSALHSLIRAMDSADLWTHHDLPFLIERIEADRVGEVTKSIQLIGKKLDSTQRTKLRDALAKDNSMENLALIYESGLKFRDDLVTLIRVFEGYFVQQLVFAQIGYQQEDVASAIAGFPEVNPFTDTGAGLEGGESQSVKRVALDHIVQRYNNDVNVTYAVKEAKKLGPIFYAPQARGDSRYSEMFYERLTKTGFEDCNSVFEN